MSAPMMEQYNNNESPYYEFKSGIKSFFIMVTRNQSGISNFKICKVH